MVNVTNNFKTECEANVGSYRWGKIEVNLIDDNASNYEAGEYSTTDGSKADAANKIRFTNLVKCESSYKYKIVLGNTAYKMKITTYTSNQTFIAAHDNLVDGSELTTEATAKYIGVTIYSTDTYSGEFITLNGTGKNTDLGSLDLLGNTTQDGTPTPSSPVDVVNVSGDNDVVISNGTNSKSYRIDLGGTQLIDFSTLSNSNTTNSFENDTLTVSTSSGTYANAFKPITTLYKSNPGKTLRFDFTNINSQVTPTTRIVGLRVVNTSNQATNYTLVGTDKSITNHTIPSDVSNISSVSLTIYANNTNTAVTNTLTIEKPILHFGSTKQNYSPYNANPIELCKIGTYKDFIRKGTGKNLFDGLIELGSINADTGELTDSTTRTRSTNYTKVKPNTWYRMTRQVGANRWIIGYKTDKTAISDGSASHPASLASIGTSGLTATFKTSPTTEYIKWYDTSSTNTTENVMISEGTEEIPFEPYGYKDKWYIEKNVGKIQFDGTEDVWTAYGATVDDNYLFRAGYFSQLANYSTDYYLTHWGRNNTSYSGSAIGSYVFNKELRVRVPSSIATTQTEMKNWVASNKPILYLPLAIPTYTLIENEELLNQLDSLDKATTLEGITNIASNGIEPITINTNLDLRENIRGKGIAPYVGFNITSEDDLISFKITANADNKGDALGSAISKQIDVEVFNENNKYNLENKQITPYTGIATTDGNFVKWQPFTITKTADTQTKNHAQYTGYDALYRGGEIYKNELEYGTEGVTMLDFARNVAKQMNTSLENNTMVNGDFIVKGNVFTNNETLTTVVKQLAEVCGGFAEINRTGRLEIKALTDTTTPIGLTTNLYQEDFSKADKFGDVNMFVIGETNIEDNASVQSDDADIALNGEHKIEILDNYFLGLQEDKDVACSNLWNEFEGFGYYPFKMSYNGFPYIDLGDDVTITDINSNTYNSKIFNYTFDYHGGYSGTAGADALSTTTSKYKTKNSLGTQFRKVGIDIDRVNGEIRAEVIAREEAIDNMSGEYVTNSAFTDYQTIVNQTLGEISNSVTETTTVLYGENDDGLISRVDANSTNITQNADNISAVVSRTTSVENRTESLETNTYDVIKQLVFGDDGLTISAKGTTSDDMKLNLTNDAIKFLYQNNAVLTINGSTIKFSNASFKKLDLGNYVWQAEDDDSLSLIYEGD